MGIYFNFISSDRSFFTEVKEGKELWKSSEIQDTLSL